MRFARVVIAGAIISGLAACGGGAPQETTATDEAATEAPAEAAATEEVATAADAAPSTFLQCKACHSVEAGKNGIGPSLAGVVGARAGHVRDFAYSDAMKASGLTWDETTLDTYLKNPRGLVPGTKMAFGGIADDAKRAEVIAYLKTL